MKLINFYESKQLSELLEMMGAPLESIGASNSWQSIDETKLEELLRTGEAEIDIDDIEIVDGVFEYQGQKVIVYIRDQYAQFYDDRGYKFHLTTCRTISKAFSDERNSRYVISLRTDGMFKINLMHEDRIIEEGKIESLKVCKNCLTSINYKGYSVYPSKKKEIYENFNLEEYFELYKGSSLNKGLFDDADRAPLNIYNEDFHLTSKKVKERDSYKCVECYVDMSKPEHRKFAHVHHIDANKANDSLSNLITLCIECHSNKPGHTRLRLTGDYQDFLGSGLKR